MKKGLLFDNNVNVESIKLWQFLIDYDPKFYGNYFEKLFLGIIGGGNHGYKKVSGQASFRHQFLIHFFINESQIKRNMLLSLCAVDNNCPRLSKYTIYTLYNPFNYLKCNKSTMFNVLVNSSSEGMDSVCVWYLI